MKMWRCKWSTVWYPFISASSNSFPICIGVLNNQRKRLVSLVCRSTNILWLPWFMLSPCRIICIPSFSASNLSQSLSLASVISHSLSFALCKCNYTSVCFQCHFFCLICLFTFIYLAFGLKTTAHMGALTLSLGSAFQFSFQYKYQCFYFQGTSHLVLFFFLIYFVFVTWFLFSPPCEKSIC